MKISIPFFPSCTTHTPFPLSSLPITINLRYLNYDDSILSAAEKCVKLWFLFLSWINFFPLEGLSCLSVCLVWRGRMTISLCRVLISLKTQASGPSTASSWGRSTPPDPPQFGRAFPGVWRAHAILWSSFLGVLESPFTSLQYWTSFFPTFNFSPFLTWYSTFFQELPKKGEWEVIWKPCASDYFYSSSLDIRVGWFYKIPGWKQFSFWIVKVLARCLLDSSVPIKSKAILIPDLCKRWWWFLSGNVKNFLSVQEISYWCALLGLCFHPLCWPPGGPLKSGNSCPVTESGDREKYYCGNDVLPFEFCVLFLEIRIHNLDTGPLFL